MKLNLLHIILFIAVIYFIRCACVRREGMAPLETGTYENNYPVGKCNVNCSSGSTITDEHYCYIQCAPDSDSKLRQECTTHCMEMMKNCK